MGLNKKICIRRYSLRNEINMRNLEGGDHHILGDVYIYISTWYNARLKS